VLSAVEATFGSPTGHARLHHDADAARRAESAGALAFADGDDIYFGDGQFQPGTPDGDRLIAHELAHVAQPGGAPRKKTLSAQQDASEVEADHAADVVMDNLEGGGGRSFAPRRPRSAALMREEDPAAPKFPSAKPETVAEADALAAKAKPGGSVGVDALGRPIVTVGGLSVGGDTKGGSIGYKGPGGMGLSGGYDAPTGTGSFSAGTDDHGFSMSGGKNKIGASGKTKIAGVAISAGADRTAGVAGPTWIPDELGRPTPAGGVWEVAWRIDTKVAASASKEFDHRPQMKQGESGKESGDANLAKDTTTPGGGASYTMSDIRTRRFVPTDGSSTAIAAAKASATTFLEAKKKEWSVGSGTEEFCAHAVDKMEVGESRAVGGTGAANASLGRSKAGLSLNVSVTGELGSAIKVEKVSESRILVTFTSTDKVGGGLLLTAAGVGLGGAKALSHAAWVQYAFELPTDRSALDDCLNSGKVPKKRRPIAHSETRTAESETNVGLGVGSIKMTRGTTVEKRDTEEDRYTKIRGYSGKAWNLSLGSYAASHTDQGAISAARHTDKGTGKQSTEYRMTSETSGTDGKANRQALARYNGLDGAEAAAPLAFQDADMAGSGAFRVTSLLDTSDAKLLQEKLGSAAGRGRFCTGLGVPAESGKTPPDVAAFIKAFVGAPTHEAMEILARKPSEGGIWTRVYGAVRWALGVDEVDNYVDLDPAPGKYNAFLGIQGHADIQARIATWRATGASMTAEAAEELARLREKLAYLTMQYYPDVPETLLRQERDRLMRYMGDIGALLSAQADRDLSKAQTATQGSDAPWMAQCQGMMEEGAFLRSQAEAEYEWARQGYGWVAYNTRVKHDDKRFAVASASLDAARGKLTAAYAGWGTATAAWFKLLKRPDRMDKDGRAVSEGLSVAAGSFLAAETASKLASKAFSDLSGGTGSWSRARFEG
jgi:hypothetical protein